ncbi:MAG TPA: ADP-glyceromanno-heptose 6-epimerase [Gemmatimonadaceae bacterium]|nr:ADP-glyceromanno-heptose 6-epimerase [Gemmatimonadaceae bacterium]
MKAPDSTHTDRLTSGSRVLVTGGAGFIGSRLIHELNNRGIENIVVSDFLGTDMRWRNIEPLAFADYVDAGVLLDSLDAGTLGDFDLVLHMGACSSTTERDAAYLMRNNYEYTRRLAHWSLDHGARFVYASSAATYGNGDAGMDDSADLSRLRTYHPLNMYGYSKHLFDMYAARNKLFDRIVGLKYFNVFGPNEQHKGDMRSMVLKAWEEIGRTGTVKLFRSYREDYRDGEQRRDFIYVNDAVAMTLHLANTPDAAGLFNIGSGRAETWLDLAYAVFAAMGREPRIDFIDMPEEMRPAYQYHTVADIRRLRDTGYDREIAPLSDSVRDYVTRYLMHQQR